MELSEEFRGRLEEAAKVKAEVESLAKEDIVKLPFHDFALVCRHLKSQSYGSLGERWVCNRLNLKRVTKNKDHDALGPMGEKIEIKFTIISAPDGKYNVVQIRPESEADSYLVLGVNLDNSGSLWHLTKKEMAEECVLGGAGSAHGARDVNNKAQELALRFSAGSSIHQRWNERYLQESIF